jgi:putative transposase
MTYIPIWAGFLYLSVVIDDYSRKVVGRTFRERMTTDLVVLALNMALTTRKPQSVIYQSNLGSQGVAGAGNL